MKTSAVIFDMDGLMLDTETISIRAWRQAAEELAISVSDDLMYSMIGRTLTDIRELLEADSVLGERAESLIRYTDNIYHRMMDETPPAIKSGLQELLVYLENHNIPKAVATSSRRFQAEKKLVDANLADRFMSSVCGDDIARGKPEPDIFFEAARQLGHAPADCLVLEDSEPGVLAAHRAGMPVIMVPDHVIPSPRTRELARAVLGSLHEVIPLLEAD